MTFRIRRLRASVSPEATLLNIPRGTAVIKAHRTSRDSRGRTLEIAENLIRGDYYKYSFSLKADEVDG